MDSYTEGIITISEVAHQAPLILWEIELFLIQNWFKSQYSTDDLKKR